MGTSSTAEVRALYEETADSYDKMMAGEISLPIYSDTLSRLSERIKHMPGIVLDTSCGSGHMLELFHANYDPQRSLVGIDLSPRMVEIAGKKLGATAKIIAGDMRDLSMIKSNSSAAVLNFFSLHHLDPDNALLAVKEWSRVLSVKGQLVLAIWEGAGSIDYGDESDIMALRYKKEEVISWVMDSGFTVTHCIVEPVEEIPMNAIYLEASKK